MSIEEKIIIDLYKNGRSRVSLAKEFKKDKRTIRAILAKHQQTLRSNDIACRKYSLDQNAFATISAESAYWIGFIASDGNVYNNQLSIGLSAKDIGHLYKLKNFLKSGHNITSKIVTLNSIEYPSCTIQIKSQKIVDDLLPHGITPRKSKTLSFSPFIPEKYLSSYILGILDGDGCFCKGPDGSFIISLTSTLNITSSIQKIFIEKCNVSATKIKEYRKSSGTYEMRYTGNKQAKRILSYVYSTSPVWLDRKYILAKEML